jgi:hypothetical protein
MTMWVWIGVGLAGLLAASLLVGLAIARILGTIGDEITELLEAEPWTSAPLTREVERLAEITQIDFAAHPRDRRSRSSQG